MAMNERTKKKEFFLHTHQGYRVAGYYCVSCVKEQRKGSGRRDGRGGRTTNTQD